VRTSGSSVRLLLWGLLLAPALCAAASAAPRLPLHWLWNARITDSIYTVSDARRDWLEREQGYVDMGIVAYVDAGPTLNAQPLICFHIGAPRTDTVCTNSYVEHRMLRALGYRNVGTEGFVQRDPVPGSVPLYRVSHPPHEDRDAEHRFVLSSQEVERLRKDGWAYDGVKGYVYPGP
jgi:hypothetical protein